MSISREAAVAAATRLAAALGLRVTEPRVLRDSSNVLVHLRPSPFVARVATLTAELRPGVHKWLTGDIELASFLLSRGLPVTRPSTDPPAGPHDVDGVTVALWHYEHHAPAELWDPASPTLRHRESNTQAQRVQHSGRRERSTRDSGTLDSRVGKVGHADREGWTRRSGTLDTRAFRELFGVVWYQMLGHRFPARVDESRAALDGWLAGR